MLNARRQEHIRRPSSIFQELRIKQSQTVVRKRKEKLRPLVPKIDDEDIVGLFKKYKDRAAENGDE
jgi:hypothetical protein